MDRSLTKVTLFRAPPVPSVILSGAAVFVFVSPPDATAPSPSFRASSSSASAVSSPSTRATGMDGSGATAVPTSPSSAPHPPNAFGALCATPAATSFAFSASLARTDPGRSVESMRLAAAETNVVDDLRASASVDSFPALGSDADADAETACTYSRTGGRHRAAPSGAPLGPGASTTRVNPLLAVAFGSRTLSSGRTSGRDHR